jgi:hypothetical protein
MQADFCHTPYGAMAVPAVYRRKIEIYAGIVIQINNLLPDACQFLSRRGQAC